eukprot:171850-Chlamydomonas_euryale.AAC.1
MQACAAQAGRGGPATASWIGWSGVYLSIARRHSGRRRLRRHSLRCGRRYPALAAPLQSTSPPHQHPARRGGGRQSGSAFSNGLCLAVSGPLRMAAEGRCAVP